MDLILKGGTVITDGVEMNADVIVRDDVVRAVGNLDIPEGAEVVDCSGKYVLPGAVDVGLNLLEDGNFDGESSAGFAQATRDAASGGVTTVIATVSVGEGETAADAIQTQSAADGKKSFVDFSYHLLVNDWSESREIQCREAILKGVPSFWVARTGMESELPSPGLLLAMADALPKDTLLITSPFEAGTQKFFERKATALGLRSEAGWAALCPPEFEAAYLYRIARLLAGTRPTMLVRGITTAAGMGALEESRVLAPSLLGAASLPHLLAAEGDGAPRTWPPIRSKQDQQAVWMGLEDGLLTLILSEHKPRTAKETAGGENKGMPQAGVASLAHFYPGLHGEGVAKWRITLATLSQTAAADPAKLAGLYPKKGSLQPGSDADIVVLNPARSNEAPGDAGLDFADPLGRQIFLGAVERVYLRGELVMAEGELAESPGGRFLSRRMALKT